MEDKGSSNKPSTTTLANRLFVRNLPFTTTEEDLVVTFSQFGNVSSVHIPVDDTKRNKGYAFINITSTKDAKLALETMDGEDFQVRLIHILPARPSAEESSGVDINDPNLTYKERQALLRQKEAEKSSKGWSASFLRGDAVVDNISDRLGLSKGDVLDVKDGISSGNAAVRLALGETHIISENIAFFDSHGVDVTALESSSKKGGAASSAKRSKTMVLVKNLPYDTSLEELTKVFHGIGGDVPKRILLPPSKTAALVEYGHATDARRAFRRLAYKKFKHVPLYLEWAPMKADGEKQKSAAMEEDATKESKTKDSSGGSSEIVVKKGLVEEDTVDTGVSQTIYVKNLNFSTSEDKLKKAFAKAGFEPRAVKIPTKAAPIKKQRSSPADSSEMKQVSMGFGFVEFSSEEEALKAMKSLQGKVVDGHALEIKLSTKSLSSSSKSLAPDKSSKNTKIMVRNVPFEATRTELLQLFGSFGQLKKVRLPKKFDGTHRGFAFCEFVTSKEAQNAMTTLSRTHLYGRHLVLEWASAADDDGKMDVVAVREKAKRDAMAAGLGGVGGTGKKKGKHLKF
jgi:multiple RNA-binding domain-containing protein 1